MKIVIIIKLCKAGCKEMKNIVSEVYRKKTLIPFKSVTGILKKINYYSFVTSSLSQRNWALYKLRKKYSKFIDNMDFEVSYEPISDIIWVCWLQGIENAPNIVQGCYRNLLKNAENKKVILITEKNMFEYVQFPDYIMEKYKNGYISKTHFSDLLRTELLVNYGGIWVDSTVLLTNRIPNILLERPLFLFSQESFCDSRHFYYNNWFIVAQKNNRVLRAVRSLLFEYYKDNDYLIDYFLWHICMILVAEKYEDDVNNILGIADVDSHFLQFNFDKKFDQHYWNYLTDKTVIHKLTYKLDSYNLENEKNFETYYDYVTTKIMIDTEDS